ncbi:MAG TPA: universal stress protein [Chthoniobacterales bacterium]
MPDPQSTSVVPSFASLQPGTVKLETVLVPVAFVGPSLTVGYALALARSASIKVVVLHVLEVPRSQLNPMVFASVEEIQSKLDGWRRQALERLDSLSEVFKAAGIRCTTSVRMGVPHEEILEEAETIRPDLIIVGSRAASTLSRFLLGGTAGHVIRHAPCSVLVARPTRTEG